VFSVYDDLACVHNAITAGAKGFVSKGAANAEVLDAIRQVLLGGVYLSDELPASVLMGSGAKGEEGERSPLERLGAREFEVFHLIGQGLKAREIASRLQVSVKTINAHRDNIKRKLQFATSTALEREAILWTCQLTGMDGHGTGE